MTLEQEFVDLVAKHDLTYEYSDDHRYWKAGSASMDKINALAAQLPREFVVATWNATVDMKIVEAYRKDWYWK